MAQIVKRTALYILLFLVLACLPSAWADPALEGAQLPADIYQDQKVELKLTIEWPASEGAYEFKSPDDIKFSNFQLLDHGQSQDTYSGSSGPTSRLALTYQIMPITAGQGMVSSFEVRYRKSRGSSWNKIRTPNILVDIKPGLPIKMILILTSITLAIIIPFALWLFRSSAVEKEHEKKFQNDPKQQVYANAALKFDDFISGYNATALKTLLSEWSSELLRVIFTCHDIPLHSASRSEVLNELAAKNIPESEIEEIKTLFSNLERLKFSADSMTSSELEGIRDTLLRYTRSKIVVGPSDFTNYLK